MRQQRGAALPGYALAVYDPDTELVTDMVACEDAHADERTGMGPLLESAQPGQLWIADRNCYEGMLIALPAPCWQRWAVAEPDEFIHLLLLAQQTNPKLSPPQTRTKNETHQTLCRGTRR